MADQLRFVIIGSGKRPARLGDAADGEVRAVRERRPPTVAGEDARLTTELILQIYKAARER